MLPSTYVLPDQAVPVKVVTLKRICKFGVKGRRKHGEGSCGQLCLVKIGPDLAQQIGHTSFDKSESLDSAFQSLWEGARSTQPLHLLPEVEDRWHAAYSGMDGTR